MSKSVILGIESSCDDTSAAIIQGIAFCPTSQPTRKFIWNMVALCQNWLPARISKILYLLFTKHSTKQIYNKMKFVP